MKQKNQLLSFGTSFEHHSNTIVGLQLSGGRVFCLAKDKRLSVTNPEAGGVEHSFDFHAQPTGFSVSSKRHLLVTGSASGAISVCSPAVLPQV